MKQLMVLLFLSLSFSASADILDRCRDAALATGYVHENILTATVHTSNLDGEDQEIFWTQLTDDAFLVIKHYPQSYSMGDYFPADTFLKFTFKLNRSRNVSEDMRLEDSQRSLIYYMNLIDGVKIDCAYAL